MNAITLKALFCISGVAVAGKDNVLRLPKGFFSLEWRIAKDSLSIGMGPFSRLVFDQQDAEKFARPCNLQEQGARRASRDGATESGLGFLPEPEELVWDGIFLQINGDDVFLEEFADGGVDNAGGGEMRR